MICDTYLKQKIKKYCYYHLWNKLFIVLLFHKIHFINDLYWYATHGVQKSCLQEWVFLLLAYYYYSTNYELIFNNYWERFPNSLIPRNEMVCHIVKHFEEMGSVEDRKHTGYPNSVYTEENM